MTINESSLDITYIDCSCRSCGYERESDHPRHSYPVKCPACGEDNMMSGFVGLLTNRATCDSEPKQYDLCGGDKTIQVYLWAATGERAGISMAPEYVPDCDDDPISVADSVLDYVNKCLYYGGKEKVELVVTAMKACQEMSDRNYCENRIKELRRDLVLSWYEYNALSEQSEEANLDDL